MTPTQPIAAQATQQIEAYLSALRTQLVSITLSAREEILREIAAHIRDSVETGTPIETVLARLGTPTDLAAEYRDGQLIRAASHSISPILLLRAMLRLAAKSLVGMLVCLFGFIGYVIGISLLLTGILKSFIPSRVGIFTNSTTASGSHELLGWWAIPIGLIGGAIILIVTTLAVRGFLHLSQRL